MFVRSVLFFLVLGISFKTVAQNKIAVYAGPQITSARYKINEEKQDAEFKFGAQAGAGLKIPFENRLYFFPTLFYSMKGYKVKLNQQTYPPSSVAIDNDTRIHTIEVAPLLHFEFSNDPSHLFVQAGPSIDYALSGKEKFNTTTGTTVSQKMKFSFADYGRFTASAVVRLGYETSNGLFAFGHYAHGFGSLNNADAGPIIKHRIVGISVGKYFSRGK